MIERRLRHLKQWGAIATRYDKHALIYHAAGLLNSIIVLSLEPRVL